jgi:cation:H+ antiporter
VRPLVVGLTVVAFCTSAPELASSVTAAFAGSPGLAVGNVVGSNIANVGLILGIAGLVRPIAVQSTVLAREVPAMIAASLLLVGLAWDGTLSRADGAAMLVALGAYLAVMVRMELRAHEPRVEAQVMATVGASESRVRSITLVGFGVGMLVLGADRLVAGATALARSSGLSEAVVGLTVMAVGTSLPELAASVAAARKGQGDMVLGNVVGSNIFNILCILGATAVIRPIEGGMATFSRDLWVGVGFAVALWPMLGRGQTLFRHEAALLVIGWSGYTWWIL